MKTLEFLSFKVIVLMMETLLNHVMKIPVKYSRKLSA